jgi:O-antigen/teichoic acid export membrane protein
VGAALSLGQSGLWLAAVVVAGAVGAPLAAYGAAFLACGLAQAAATWWVVGRPEPPDWARWRPALRWMVARGWPLGLAGLMGTIYYRLDGPLLFHLRGAREAGLYAAAYRFLDVAQLAPGALGAVLLPVLARLWGVGDQERFQRALRLAVAVAAAVGAPVAFGAVVAGHRVASAVYGARFERSGDVLAVLGLAFFSIATGYVYAGVLIAMGRVRIVGAVAAVAAVGSLVADLAVIPRWGAVGAAWVTVVTEYVVSTTLALWIHRRHRVAFPWDRVGRALVAGLAMAVVAWPLRSLPLPVLLAAAAGAYAAFAFTVGALRGSDLRALLDRGDVLGP